MPGRRGFLKALGIGAAAAGVAALPGIAEKVKESVEPVPQPPVESGFAVNQVLGVLAPANDVPPMDPFLGWGYRIRAQAGCTDLCAKVRYSEIEGIVALRHEGFQGPVVKLHEDDWHGSVAAVRESTAINLLARKHLVWSGKAPNGPEGGFDWDAAVDAQLDQMRFEPEYGRIPYRIESRDGVMKAILDETATTYGRSGSLPKRRA